MLQDTSEMTCYILSFCDTADTEANINTSNAELTPNMKHPFNAFTLLWLEGHPQPVKLGIKTQLILLGGV